MIFRCLDNFAFTGLWSWTVGGFLFHDSVVLIIVIRDIRICLRIYRLKTSFTAVMDLRWMQPLRWICSSSILGEWCIRYLYAIYTCMWAHKVNEVTFRTSCPTGKGIVAAHLFILVLWRGTALFSYLRRTSPTSIKGQVNCNNTCQFPSQSLLPVIDTVSSSHNPRAPAYNSKVQMAVYVISSFIRFVFR